MKIDHYWWHYIPLSVLAIFLLLLYLQPYVGMWLLLLLRWFVVAMVIWAIVAIVRSLAVIGGPHKTAISIYTGVIVIAILGFLLLVVPVNKCDPDKMARHYEKQGMGIEELVTFTQVALDEGQTMLLEFEHGKVASFHTSKNGGWNVSDSLKTVLMSEVGLDKEEFQSIKKRLKDIGCIRIETHFPEYCNIGYKRVGMGMYLYRVYLSPMNDEQRQEALSDYHLIPYNDHVAFMFGGGAAGPDTFSKEVKDKFLKKQEAR